MNQIAEAPDYYDFLRSHYAMLRATRDRLETQFQQMGLSVESLGRLRRLQKMNLDAA